MREIAAENEKLVNEVISDERKYTVDANGYRQYEGMCTECNANFTRNIPNSWFDGNNQIKEHNLPNGVKIEVAQRALESTICGACEPENAEKLKEISRLNNTEK